MAQQHDIEDVLTSIRRLVANESGPAAHIAKTPAPTEGPTLVLSDTHRVTEPEDPFQMIRSLAQAEVDSRDAEHLTDILSDDMAAITSDLSEELEAEADDAQTSDEASDDVTPEMPAFLVVHAADDYTEDADFEAEAPEAAPEEVAAPDATADAESTTDEAEADTRTGDTAKEESGLSDLAALSRALGADDGDEALRDLITEIVRQELAGELGERITRNVRKLVRREIRQMMASEEFD